MSAWSKRRNAKLQRSLVGGRPPSSSRKICCASSALIVPGDGLDQRARDRRRVALRDDADASVDRGSAARASSISLAVSSSSIASVRADLLSQAAARGVRSAAIAITMDRAGWTSGPDRLDQRDDRCTEGAAGAAVASSGNAVVPSRAARWSAGSGGAATVTCGSAASSFPCSDLGQRPARLDVEGAAVPAASAGRPAPALPQASDHGAVVGAQVQLG